VVYYLGERRRVAQFASRQQLARLRAERDAAEVRLAVLQAQVEPHFLFNMIQSEPARAEQVIDALGTYLRATLPRLRDGGAAETNLGGQLDLVSGYLDIMNVRMAGRIAVKVEADETVRALPFPPLILLTLVENAITHGLEPKVGPGMIAIAATADSETLTVSVEDDGVGLKPGVSNGLGLANIRAQLSSLFGARAALEVDARPEGGVSARIRVPLGDS
jgi:sensor histidine kinase YesM